MTIYTGCVSTGSSNKSIVVRFIVDASVTEGPMITVRVPRNG